MTLRSTGTSLKVAQKGESMCIQILDSGASVLEYVLLAFSILSKHSTIKRVLSTQSTNR